MLGYPRLSFIDIPLSHNFPLPEVCRNGDTYGLIKPCLHSPHIPNVIRGITAVVTKVIRSCRPERLFMPDLLKLIMQKHLVMQIDWFRTHCRPPVMTFYRNCNTEACESIVSTSSKNFGCLSLRKNACHKNTLRVKPVRYSALCST